MELRRGVQAGLEAAGFSATAHNSHVADMRGRDGIVRRGYVAGPPVLWRSLLAEASGTPDLNVTVSVGLAVVNGVPLEKESAKVVTFVDPGTTRIDLIQIDEHGTISVKEGISADGAADTNQQRIAEIALTDGITAIPAGSITDRRTFV